MKHSFLLVAILIVSLSSRGQKGGSFGLKAGANLYTITGEGLGNNKSSNVNMHGGIFYRLPLVPLLYLQPELLYSGEGAKGKEDDVSITLSMNYINMPLMLQLAAPNGFFAETGPQIGFLLSAKSKFSYDGLSMEEDIKENLHNVSFSWGVGAGYMFGNAGLGARYNFGLNRLPKDSEDGNNKSIGLQVSFLWRLRK